MKNYFLKNNKSKQFEDQLKESELRYRRLFESAKDGILILDFESGNIVDANPFIVKLIDYPLNEILGRKLWEIGLFADKQEAELAFIELKTNSYIRYEDKPIKRRNGNTVEVEFISNVYFANKVKVIQCNIRDITERKQAEKKQKLTTSILSILSSQENWEELIINIIDEIKGYTDIENVLIHLTENEEYSHYNEGKLSDYQYDAKIYLYQKDQEAGLKFKINEKSYINCLCNVVISGKTDASLPYFSKGGSFYSDNSNDIYTAIDKLEKPIEVLNLSGLIDDNSVALIPLYSGNDIIGILQLSDKRPDMFSIDTIRYLESIGKTIAIAFKRIKNENKIRNNEQFLKKQNLDYVSLNKEYSKLNKELSESIK
ncbi:MAG: PAS domain S-box protein, partial [Bacteroidales bacterium]|nr:PAS domain S-box protein [Bacteroidales bacterium]